MALPPLGIQLGIFGGKYDMKTQQDQVLDSVVRAGFTAVEGSVGGDAAAYKRKLDSRGLVMGGAHITMPALENLPTLVNNMTISGASDICNSGILRWGDLSESDYAESIPLLNAAGRTLRAAGIHLHYHNHDFEFKPIAGGKRGI